jgi:TRAP transporter 4TM/12TM fusion protein
MLRSESPVDANLTFDLRRELSLWPRRASYWLSVGLSLFIFYGLFVEPIDPWIFRAAYLTVAAILVFIHVPARRAANRERPTAVDVVWIALAVVPLVYLTIEFRDLYFRAGGIGATTPDVIVGTIASLVVLEITRRSAGLPLMIIAAIFIIYAWVGPYLPGLFWDRGFSYERVVSFLYSTGGIYTTPLAVSVRYVFVFIFFGGLLQRCGAGDLFVNLAKAAVGRTRGGIMKVPLISSALFGTISGAAVANVVTTGSITIPAMKRENVPAAVAGAIESVAATGGQIMPPVMGAAAFLMADILGIPYSDIVIAAIIPACLYYISIYFMIDFEASKAAIEQPKRDQLSLRRVLVERGHLLVPLLAIIYELVVEQASPNRAAMIGIIATLLASWLRSEGRLTPRAILNTMAESGPAIMELTAATAAAGIIIGMLSLTGLGVKGASIIISYGGGSLFGTLVLGMVICLILGLGLPTVAAYAMAATVVPSALMQFGVSALGAHMFIFYFCVLAAITPPVAMASFAAAAIARANLWAVGYRALLYGVAGFIIPFMFVYRPPLLMHGTVISIILTTIVALIGVLALASALQGWIYWFGRIGLAARTALGVASLLLIYRGIETDIAGFLLLLLIASWLWFRRSKRAVFPAVQQ